MPAPWFFLLLGSPEILLEPTDPRLGDLVQVTVAASAHTDGPGHIEAFFCRYPLMAEHGRLRGYVAVPTDTSTGTHPIRIRWGPRSWSSALKVRSRSWGQQRLRVDAKYSRPRSDALRDRLEQERARMDAVWRRPVSPTSVSPLRLERPAPGRISGVFGTQRRFNGEVRSVHYGLDVAAPVGTPVQAAAPGTVVLTGNFWASGRTVMVDHGAGLITTHLHLSKIRVSVGDRVRARQVLGEVGASGRVTGPHLHWGVAVRCEPLHEPRKPRGMYVDPGRILRAFSD